jgi:hypothetical protein
MSSHATNIQNLIDRINHQKRYHLTATSSVQGEQIYVKDTEEGKGFTVAIDDATDSDIRFNWWIIEEE